MDLDQQVQLLIKSAPQDGTTPKLIAAIAPALKLMAQQLQHSQYYILQSLEQNWVLTTLSNRLQPNLEKSVIYAFPTLKDVSAIAQMPRDPQVIALPVPTIHILFQLMAMETVDSIIFFETPGQLDVGTEVKRVDLQNLVESYFQQNQGNLVPPNFA